MGTSEINGRYSILEAAAGEGGYGRVDKALDTELDREVAIKTLDPLFKTRASAEDIERFRREAKSLARLSHPNIPAIYDVRFNETAGEFKIVFEWIEGVSLRDHLQGRGVMSLEEARHLFTQICSALSHAHSKDIIHRDIKPANIILRPEATSFYLVDFGIALSQADLSRITGSSPVGTAGYMSPEQERGDDLTHASDLFSLGILLYECLAGSRPTAGSYKALSISNESIPPSIDALIQESLSPDPERRPASAREFSNRLNEALRPHSTFTGTLSDGSLFEIQVALNKMDPAGFASLPEGQRVLLVTRLDDLARVDEPRIRNAVAALVTELARLGHESRREQYQRIVKYAFEYGYEKQYGEAWHGNGPARGALSAVALRCGTEAHGLIAEEVLRHVESADLLGKPGWYFHDLRIMLQNLLTNPSCPDDRAAPLGDALATVNEVSHQPAAE